LRPTRAGPGVSAYLRAYATSALKEAVRERERLLALAQALSLPDCLFKSMCRIGP
jgi:hypothetical protein